MVREAYLLSFSKETSEDLLEKIGLVFAANPDRELVNDLYYAHKTSKTLLRAQREKIIEMVSEKVSLALGGSPWPKELVIEAQQKYEERIKSEESPNTQEKATPQPTTNVKASGFYKNIKKATNTKENNSSTQTSSSVSQSSTSSNDSFLSRIGWTELNVIAKATLLFFTFGAILWGIALVAIIMKFLF